MSIYHHYFFNIFFPTQITVQTNSKFSKSWLTPLLDTRQYSNLKNLSQVILENTAEILMYISFNTTKNTFAKIILFELQRNYFEATSFPKLARHYGVKPNSFPSFVSTLCYKISKSFNNWKLDIIGVLWWYPFDTKSFIIVFLRIFEQKIQIITSVIMYQLHSMLIPSFKNPKLTLNFV